MRHALLCVLALIAVVLATALPAMAQARCEAGVQISGLNRFAGTVWTYWNGPVGKVVVLVMFAFGMYETVIAHNKSLGLTAIAASGLLAFSGDIINTLFSGFGSGSGLC